MFVFGEKENYLFDRVMAAVILMPSHGRELAVPIVFNYYENYNYKYSTQRSSFLIYNITIFNLIYIIINDLTTWHLLRRDVYNTSNV